MHSLMPKYRITLFRGASFVMDVPGIETAQLHLLATGMWSHVKRIEQCNRQGLSTPGSDRN